mmetsp:Transcript_16287/g.39981  ORF Transcript_16287/g.39981 Transcript_16287/m.39981 type:complete len:259 (+) Transcript_16287:229-1005(+)
MGPGDAARHAHESLRACESGSDTRISRLPPGIERARRAGYDLAAARCSRALHALDVRVLALRPNPVHTTAPSTGYRLARPGLLLGSARRSDRAATGCLEWRRYASLIAQLKATASWGQAVRVGTDKPPLALLVVPFSALAENQEEDMTRYLDQAFGAGRLSRRGKAVLVRRDDTSWEKEEGTEDGGGQEAWAPPRGSQPAPVSSAAVGDGAIAHISLPCGKCAACSRTLDPNLLGRIPKIDGDPCCWCCAVQWPQLGT